MESPSPEELIAVSVADFTSGKKVPVDLYVRLSENKFVLIVKAGSETQLDRLKKYSEKDMQYFYVKKDQYSSYIDQKLSIAGILIGSNKVDHKQKTAVLSNVTTSVFHELEEMKISEQAFSHARQISESMQTLVNARPDFAQLIDAIDSLPGELVRHSVAVSILGSMIAREIGWEKKGTIEKIALGGLLHDIGKKELPAEILTKPRAQMTFEEVTLYESHPYRGLQILQTLPAVPDDVLAIAYEHHENSMGLGFPRRLKDMRLNPLARVVALANAFCDLTLRSEQHPNPRSTEEAIHYIENTMGAPFNKEAFRALKKLVGQQETDQ